MTCCILFLFLNMICFSFSCRIHATKFTSGNESDRLVLLDFKQSVFSVEIPRQTLTTWNDSLHFCKWEGVTCGNRHRQRVTRLDLDSKGLAGTLSPSVGNLSFLRVLNLQNNSFGGEIPSQIGNLFRLKFLALNNNTLKGEIPANISHCFRLEYINVGYNKLVGKIPEEFSALSSLSNLRLHSNNLTGGIPDFLGNLSSLEVISTGYNLLGGSISYSIGQLKNLKILALGGNNLSGIIPPPLYNLSLLIVLSLPGNELHGSLPPDIGLMLPRLQYLQLSVNQFTGTLPRSLSNCSDLSNLYLDVNYFRGSIGINFGFMKNLYAITMQGNELGGGEVDEMDFIHSLTNCSNFSLLELSSNKLRRPLPIYVGNLSHQMFFINFEENQIRGRLPSSIGNLVHLEYLLLGGNQFTGEIPLTIGNLWNLQRLEFSENQFSGTIPDSIGNLSLLNELYMDTNILEGTMPTSLGNLKSLLALYLFQNNLSGTIPRELFRLSSLSIALNLSQNHLHGTLSPDVGNLKNLGTMDLSKNDLSGNIPTTLGSCTSLEYLFIHENNFQGPIPSSLSFLNGIRTLDLSCNNLSGQIPQSLEKLSLEYLNLSFNNFEGRVPVSGVFANQSALSLYGNNKLCGGIPQLNLGNCFTVKSKKRHGLSQALIIVISVICSLLCVTIMLFFLFCWHKTTRKERLAGQPLQEPFLRVSYEMLLKATNGFSVENLIGSGGFGSVYKGTLDVDNKVVAVKILNLGSQRAFKSFMTECEALRTVRHRNIVSIISACSSIDFNGNDFKALVYNYMPNGSLEEWLYSSQEANLGQSNLQKLNLLQRINIAIDVASALDYLHNQCENCIIHCDLKPSNILLDEEMVAHVADFGIAKFLLPELTAEVQSNSAGVRGTIGYAAPEYGLGSEVSTMGDVYSFGIILLETMTGKRPTDPMFEGSLTLHTFAKMSLDGDNVLNILDPFLVSNVEEQAAVALQNRMLECVISCIEIGVGCSMELAQERMDIKTVTLRLQSVRNLIKCVSN